MKYEKYQEDGWTFIDWHPTCFRIHTIKGGGWQLQYTYGVRWYALRYETLLDKVRVTKISWPRSSVETDLKEIQAGKANFIRPGVLCSGLSDG
jgi:hypothetical protein